VHGGLTDNAELADSAHTLVSTAGMFGFERLSAIAHAFEQAVRTNSSDAGSLADEMAAAIGAMLQELQRIKA
jgi:HPt (histidine-containing phosphotransfer) domain-containing protein